ncbi:hypothetical protein TorRG33x02_338910 [Trema orientale]|uniref:Uncharacterized protein n=1 Tax=Trema orientale TaxID=63057 RepID=A0A2P5AX17_TREOI|nr:hypothetical protein TorRG33x02_338910 [Trema orientale]
MKEDLKKLSTFEQGLVSILDKMAILDKMDHLLHNLEDGSKIVDHTKTMEPRLGAADSALLGGQMGMNESLNRGEEQRDAVGLQKPRCEAVDLEFLRSSRVAGVSMVVFGGSGKVCSRAEEPRLGSCFVIKGLREVARDGTWASRVARPETLGFLEPLEHQGGWGSHLGCHIQRGPGECRWLLHEERLSRFAWGPRMGRHELLGSCEERVMRERFDGFPRDNRAGHEGFLCNQGIGFERQEGYGGWSLHG